MSTNNDSTDDSTDYDQFVSHLSNEAQQALDQIEQTVEASETAAHETGDVAEPIVDALIDLSHGDRVGAVQAAMLLFSDDTSADIAEARAACLAALTEAETSGDELMDVVDMVAEQAGAVADALSASELADRLRGMF